MSLMPLATTTTLSMLFASCKNKNYDTKQNQELQIAKTNLWNYIDIS
ncbi:hypothetical protein [Mycoplasmopsis californica]|nr:hypothetical protein [Mycoplasmopsis californica]